MAADLEATAYRNERVRSVVFAAAVPPYMAQTDDNPNGPLDQATADELESGLKSDRDAFFDRPALLRVAPRLWFSEQQGLSVPRTAEGPTLQMQ